MAQRDNIKWSDSTMGLHRDFISGMQKFGIKNGVSQRNSERHSLLGAISFNKINIVDERHITLN